MRGVERQQADDKEGGGQGDKAKVLAAFDRVQCNGSTNLEDGMRQAYQQSCGALPQQQVAATFQPSDAVPTIPNVPMLGSE